MPALTKDSTAYPPTPPTPITATVIDFILFKLSIPINFISLSNILSHPLIVYHKINKIYC